MKSQKHLFTLLLLLSLLAVLSQSFAQVGNDNPTGPSGAFNGSVNTGCSYDPYTGNATRAVMDIVVNGAVGTIPLAVSRVYNSRLATAPFCPFGVAGSWQHNYNWSIPDTGESGNSNPPLPTSISVSFPDGHAETYVYSASDVYYRAALGTRGRFVPFDSGTKLGYLISPDSSKVEFKGTIKSRYDGELHVWYYWYTFRAQALIDPFGQRTSLTYTGGTINKVTEPGGRYLQFYYTTIGGISVVDHVTGSDGRTVQYSYIQSAFSPGTTSYVCLDHIVYYGDSQWTAKYKYRAPNVGGANGVPLVWTCDDPMYGGPMKRIGYTYATANNADGSAPVYGEILSENYYDGTNVGAALTTLSVNNSTRTETRADTKTRTFTYTSYKLTGETDFRGVSASKAYDSNYYINAITDRNGHTTNFTLNAFTGAVLTTTFPSTPGDTPPNTPRGVVTITYGWTNCPDPNNRDANNPYYPYSVTDEGGHTTIYTRDANKRVTRIDYPAPDGGYETFTYNSFNQVLSHVLTTGGTEASTYDATGNKLTYRDPYHDPIYQTGNPSAWYTFDSLNHLSQVTDALGSAAGDVNHTTSYGYNARGQLISTTYPTDPVDNQRHTVTNVYNSDGTIQNTTDQLSHVISFTYDDYRRLLTATTPQRATGDNTPRTTYTYYDGTGTGNDYTHADPNVTHLKLPGGEVTTTAYDENFRKTSVTAAYGTTDAAKTSFGYDNVGNLTSVIAPKEQPGQPYAGQNTIAAYDERNRIMSVTDPLGNVTSCKYDAAGRKASVTRANGQVATYDSYNSMNRLLQQTIKQTPDPDAVTKYTYYTSGLLHTMQDPYLVANNSNYNYSYVYDQMGRKASLTYPPPTTGGNSSSESWNYDTAGRIYTFTNRAGKVQTFVYDALNRPTNVSWNDSSVTPITYGYDVASRTTSIGNVTATITRAYFNDNLLNTETTTYQGDNTLRTVTYTYNADAGRASIQYPNNAYTFSYTPTARNQLWKIINNSGGGVVMTYLYDLDGDLTTRTPDNSTSSTYTYDALDRVTNISHALNGTTRTFAYAYDSVSNRKWTKRDGGTGDVFGYDLNDQTTAILLDVSNPDTTAPGSQTITYDANGNRITFAAYAPTGNYTTNNLNQYSSRNSSQATYDISGNMTTGMDGSTYTYDARNRLLSATKAVTTETFTYDGLGRQVNRKIGAGQPVYNVYDGWNLIGEYAAGATSPSTAYLAGAGGLVKNLSTTLYYYQDASGCSSHLADSTGHLLEWYRYDLQGTPIFYNASNSRISASGFGVRHLFTGEQWYSELGVYDLRNRFYSPDIGRFLQADPSGFNGDANLYRFCGNNPLNSIDPAGLFSIRLQGGVGGALGILTGAGGIFHIGGGVGININVSNLGSSRLYFYGQFADNVVGLGAVAAAGPEGGIGGSADEIPSGWSGDVTIHAEGGGAIEEGVGLAGDVQTSNGDISGGAMGGGRDLTGGGGYLGAGWAANGYYGLPSISTIWSGLRDAFSSSAGGTSVTPGSRDVVWWDANGNQHIIPGQEMNIIGSPVNNGSGGYSGPLSQAPYNSQRYGPNFYGGTGSGIFPGGRYVNAFGGGQYLGAGSVANILAGGTASSWDTMYTGGAPFGGGGNFDMGALAMSAGGGGSGGIIAKGLVIW